jgi:sugar O-acyltransferase (sialic acid O-acetyltransferase NeuD family)
MILFGASGHGKVIIEILECMHEPEILLWDDAAKPPVWDYPVQQPLAADQVTDKQLIISVGVNATRKKIAARFEGNIAFGKAIHPDAFLSKRASVGKGTVVMAGVRVNADVKIGKHCIVNTCASIDHDCVLEDFVHISPNATLSGDVRVGEGTHIGSGASVIQGIRIGKWCTIGAGAAVVRDIPDYSTAVGCPAKVIKTSNL